MIPWDCKAQRAGAATNGRKCPAISAKTVVVSLRSSRGSLFHGPSLINETALCPRIDERETIDSNASPSETTEIVVRDLGREEMTVAPRQYFLRLLASSGPLTGMKRQNVLSRRSIGRDDSEYVVLVPPQRCEPLAAAWVRGSEQRGEDTTAGVKASSGLETAPRTRRLSSKHLSRRIPSSMSWSNWAPPKNARPARAHSTHT